MTDSTLPRLSRAQLRQVLEAQVRGEHPPCFVCGGRVTAQHATLGTVYEEQRVLTSQPCGHQVTYNVNVAGQAQAELEDERDAADDQSPWCCTGNAEDCALCADPNPPCPYLCPGHPRTAGNERIVGEAFAATEATETAKPLNLRKLIADALAAAAFECDGQCGLSEEACYEAHPITWAATSNGVMHVTASVTAIADVVLAALTGPVPEGLDTESWTAVRAIKLMSEAGARREAAEARVRVLEAEVAAARRFAEAMREFCPADGVAVHHADELIAVMDNAKAGRP